MPAPTKQQVEDLLAKIDDTYWGPEERAMIDEALALTQQLGDEPLEYQVRMRLTASAARTGDNDAMLSSFAWCLAKHDADPTAFPTVLIGEMSDLMWQFKWMAGAIYSSPAFTLAQGKAVLDDMEAHYRKENLGLSGVLMARFEHAWKTGDIEGAKALRTELQTTPRDDHSHCDACGRSELAGFAAETGDEAQALKLVDEIIEGGFTCGEEPEHALARTLVARLRAGRLDEARDQHIRSYRLARDNPDNITIVAHDLAFCAITGNEARGLAMLERHLPWLSYDALNELGQFNLLLAMWAVLESVLRVAQGDQVVRGANRADLAALFGPHDAPWTVAELTPVMLAAATKLADAFDARNGNAYYAGKIASQRALLDEHYDVPIATDVFAPPEAAVPQPRTPVDWLDAASVYGFSNMPDEAADAARHALASSDAALRATALKSLISVALFRDDIDEAKRLFAERQQALREGGRPSQADMEQRVGLTIMGQHAADSQQRLEAELARLTATSTGPELADVQTTLAELLSQQDDCDIDRVKTLFTAALEPAAPVPDLQAAVLRNLMEISAYQDDQQAALGFCDRLLALPLSAGFKTFALYYRARLLADLDRGEEGIDGLDEAARIYAKYGVRRGVVDCTLLATELLRRAGRHDEELAHAHYALREAELMDVATTGIRYRLGRALTATGNPDAAGEVLWQVDQDEEAAGEEAPASRAETKLALAEAFEAGEHYGNAVSMYRDAADLLVEAEQPADAANMLRRAANILREFEMWDDACETINKAYDLVKGTKLPMEVQVLEARGYAKAGAGDATALDDVDAAIAIVQADPDGPFTWKIGDLTDSKGRMLMDLERREEAVAVFLQAADSYAAGDDLASAARAEHFAAQNLAGPLERPADAVPIYKAALARADEALKANPETDTDLRESIIVKLAEALEQTGRAAEAAAVRAKLSG